MPSRNGSADLSPLLYIAFFLLAVLALGFLAWAHLWYWRRRFAPWDCPDEVHWARTEDGWRVHLRRYLPRGPSAGLAEPVILCHGLGANHYNVDWDPPYGIAQYLAERGRDCWVISLRGHDGSDRPSRYNSLKWGFGFDAFLLQDVPAAIDLVLAKTGASQAQWVGHSMGGMLAYALGGTPHERKLAGGVVALGAPASFLHQAGSLRLLTLLGKLLAGKSRVPQRWVTQMIAPFTGYFDPPFSEIAIAPKSMDGKVVRRMQSWAFEDISAGVIHQFHDWVTTDSFRSADKVVDYRQRMGAFTSPILLVAGTEDKLAPPSSVVAAQRWLGSQDKALTIVGKDYGSLVDYGHGDLLLGKGAPAEVYPIIADWLEQKATPAAAP